MSVEISKIYDHINKSFKKSLIDKISKRLKVKTKIQVKSFSKIKVFKVFRFMLLKKYCHHYNAYKVKFKLQKTD